MTTRGFADASVGESASFSLDDDDDDDAIGKLDIEIRRGFFFLGGCDSS